MPDRPDDDPAVDTLDIVPDGRWDLVVVGAGPAGCAAAAARLGLDPSARVLLLDRHEFPRDKSCGDGIAAEAFDVLRELGFDLDTVVAGYDPVTSLRLTAPGGAVADRTMRRSVRVIPRQVFDARLLADVLARGAQFRRHQVRRIERSDTRVVIDDAVEAEVLIGADGAESVVRRAGTSRPGIRPWTALAIRGYTVELPDQGGAQLITMGATNWPAYAWSFPIGGGRANVGYGELLTDRALDRSAMIDRMRTLLPGLVVPSQLLAHRLPLTPGRPRVVDGRVLLVGDALSLINPLSGEGIFYALRSGALAGLASCHGSAAGARYRAALAGSLGAHLRHTDLLSRLTRVPRLIDAGVRTAAADQRTFDELVRLSLGDGRFTPRLAGGVMGHLLR